MQGIIAFILIFFVVVTVHEFGHFIVAKKSGILAQEFAIGMGPKIFHKKIGETNFTIRLLPVGGYVKMPDNVFDFNNDVSVYDLKKGMKVNLKLDENDRFVYNIDIYKTRFRTNRGTRIIDNISIDYSKILETSLEDMKKINEEMSEGIYKQNQKELLQGIEEYIERECKAIEKSNRKDKEKTIQYLKNIENKKAITFEESIQRIMFYNQLLWRQNLVKPVIIY